MMLPGPVEWEGERTKLVSYRSLPQNTNFPYNWRKSGKYHRDHNRHIRNVIVHQTAGAPRNGQEAAERLAQWIIKSPVFNDDGKRIGGGRGWPGAPYHFLIPNIPQTHEGKMVIYRLWDDDWRIWHTRRHNRYGIGVVLAGSFYTRHAPKFSDRDPTSVAMDCLQDLVCDYLLPRYGLTNDDVMGHFDAGKSTCPGDMLEAWVRRLRGENVAWDRHAKNLSDNRPLNTRSEKNEALKVLGYADGLNLSNDEDFRSAVEALQADSKIVIDGIWGPQTDKAARLALWHSVG